MKKKALSFIITSLLAVIIVFAGNKISANASPTYPRYWTGHMQFPRLTTGDFLDEGIELRKGAYPYDVDVLWNGTSLGTIDDLTNITVPGICRIDSIVPTDGGGLATQINLVPVTPEEGLIGTAWVLESAIFQGQTYHYGDSLLGYPLTYDTFRIAFTDATHAEEISPDGAGAGKYLLIGNTVYSGIAHGAGTSRGMATVSGDYMTYLDGSIVLKKWSTQSEPEPEPEPEITTTNINGEQLEGWDMISNMAPMLSESGQNPVENINQGLLHVNANYCDKLVPKSAVEAVGNSALQGMHVFIGNGSAVTFLKDFINNSSYTDTDFSTYVEETENSKKIHFINPKDLGCKVVYHTTVPEGVFNVMVTYMSDEGIKMRTISPTPEGRICLEIDSLRSDITIEW